MLRIFTAHLEETEGPAALDESHCRAHPLSFLHEEVCHPVILKSLLGLCRNASFPRTGVFTDRVDEKSPGVYYY
jgi:hypothetical protein